jgi:hypothetical protein
MSAVMTVTNRTISYGGQTWQVPNLTRIFKEVSVPEKPYKWKSIAGMVVVAIIGLFVLGEREIWGLWLLLGSIAFIIYAKYENSKVIPSYWLSLETASGSTEAFFSYDEQFIDQLIARITEIMDHSDIPANLAVNIDNRTVYDKIDNSTIIDRSVVR